MTTLNRRQRKRVKAAFRSFSGPDWLIDYPEWKQALGIKNDFLATRIFDLVDTDGTGFIDFDEFLVFAGYLYSDDKRKRLEFIFRIYDLEDDGAIDRKEIRQILEASVSEQRVALTDDVMKGLVTNFMHKTDLDKDGNVSCDDFVEAIGKYPGIEAQFALYAADWLNEGQGFKSPPIRAAGVLRRVKLAWRSRRRRLFWGLVYIVANVTLFTSAMHQYADAGANLAIQLARGAAACVNLNVALILIPMCKSFWTWVRHTRWERLFPLDNMVEIHRAIGHIIATFAVLHIGSHLYNYWQSGRSLTHELFSTEIGITGVAITAILAFMLRYGRKVKERQHELFVLSHLLYGGFLAGLLYHAAALYQWLALPLVLFFLDCLVRQFRKTRRINIVEMKPLANGVTRVYFKKPKRFDFYPGDYLKLHIPEISRLQWHPFTISAAPEATTIGVHVRNSGDWTGALHNLSRNKSLENKKWKAKIDGPYSAPSSKVYRSKVAVLIAAGIGVTPFASMLQSIVLRHLRARSEKSKPDQFIYFHWLNRSQRSYEWFMDLLSEAEQTLGADRFKLHIHLTSLTHDLTNIAMQVAMDSYHERNERDPITGLIAETSAGRPDWDSVFQSVASAHPGEPVDVYFCGPPALGTAVRKKCRRHGLLYHEEKF